MVMYVKYEHGEYWLIMDNCGISESLVRTKFRRMSELYEENVKLKTEVERLTKETKYEN
jgi:hypothetical protein